MGISPPPCYSPKRLLPLLLMGLALQVGRLNALADQIFLKSSSSPSSERTTYVGLAGTWNQMWLLSSVTESESENTYTHGTGRTNMSRNWQDVAFIYFEPDFPLYFGDPDTYSRHITNRDTFGWGTNGLLPGIGTNSDHLIEYYWLPTSTLVTDTNAVVVTTNISPPAAVSSPWPLGVFGLMVTNYDTGTNIVGTTTNFASDTSTLSLATSGTDTNKSALYCLTGSVIDPYSYWPNPIPITSGWELAGLVPDTLGRVFKVFNDGTTNGASVALDSSLTGTNYYYTYTVQPARLTLVMEWKGTNATNWSQSWPLHVLKGTTVDFRVITPGFEDVAYPTGLPEWSNGATGVEQISITFDTISGTTNGQPVIVTAGSKATNQVVVYDFGIVAKGQDIDFSDAPRSLYGVGELVDFTAGFDPVALSNSFPLTFTWSGQGSASTNGFAEGDQSILAGQSFKAGCQAETFAVTATLASGINAGTSRTTNVSIIAPTNAILLPIKSAGIQEYVFASNTNVGHTQFTHSCTKKAHWQLEPDTVSFKWLSIAEGTATYSWLGGSTNIYGSFYYDTNWLTNTTPANLAALNPHPQGNWVSIGHGNHLDGFYYNVSDGADTFGVAAGQGGLPTGTHMGQQVTLSPSPAKTNTVSIPVAYRVSVKTNVFAYVESTKAFGPEGSTTIKKDGLGATKGFLEIDSPVE